MSVQLTIPVAHAEDVLGVAGIRLRRVVIVRRLHPAGAQHEPDDHQPLHPGDCNTGI
jgi:hypothetical protein